MVKHFGAVFDWRRFRDALEDAAEIGGIAEAATDGNILEFEIVIAEEEFAPGNSYVRQVINESHVTVPVKDAREVVGADAEQVGHGIACDVVLVIALEINANAFEKTLAAILGFGGRFVDKPLDALDERTGQVRDCRGGFLHRGQFKHRFKNMRNGAADGSRHGEFMSDQLWGFGAFGGNDADAELFFPEQERHDFDFAFPRRVIPAIGRDEQGGAGLEADGFDFSILLNAVFVAAFERNFEARERDNVAEEWRVQLAAADKDFIERTPGKQMLRPPIQGDG